MFQLNWKAAGDSSKKRAKSVVDDIIRVVQQVCGHIRGGSVYMLRPVGWYQQFDRFLTMKSAGAVV